MTHERRTTFHEDLARSLLHTAIEEERGRRPFELDAIVLLPEHIHMLMKLPEGDNDYSTRIGRIKKEFTEAYLAAGGQEGRTTASRDRQRYRGVWQKRFRDHVIRDRRDWVMHVDYIHYNPLKHGLVKRVIDWPWSSFHRFVQAGAYEPDWVGPVHLPDTEYLEPW